MRHDLIERRLRRQHRHAATEVNQNSENVAFHAKIQRHHRKTGCDDVGSIIRIRWQMPRPLRPLVGLGGAHDLGEIHTLQASKGPRLLQRRRLINVIPRHDAAALSTTITQDPRQLPRINFRDGDGVGLQEIVAQTLLGAEVGG